MYCTGGVRCERASAFLRSRGVTDVYQLLGGIHAYQERFGRDDSGSFFKGKNFVYDPRIATPSQSTPIGACLACLRKFDDYSFQIRCSACRVLILVCPDCRQGADEIKLQCEMCGCK